jgi:hypothetical protein
MVYEAKSPIFHEYVHEICYLNTCIELIIQLYYASLGVIHVGGPKRLGEFMAKSPDLHTRIETGQCA